MKELWFFCKLFKPYRLWLVSGLALALLTSLSSVALLTLSGWFITSSAIAGFLAPDGVAVAFNFIQPAAQIRALAIIRTTGRYAERIITHEATFRLLAEVRSWFFAKLIPFSHDSLKSFRSAELLNGITQDIDLLDAIYLRLMLPIFIALLAGSIVAIFLFGYSTEIGLVLSVLLILTMLVLPLIFYTRSKKCNEQVINSASEYKIKQIEILQGLAELNLFNAYQRYKNQMTKIAEKMIDGQRKNNQITALLSALYIFISQLAVLTVLVLGGFLFQQESITGPQLVMCGFAVLACFEIGAPVITAIPLFGKTQAAAKKILAITEGNLLKEESAQLVSMPDVPEIAFKHLSFRYDKNTDWVLRDINLSIPYGSKIAIVGKSGMGKTSLIQLLMKFYQQQHGSIEFSGIDHQRISTDQLIKHISLLTQHTELFAASIRENLLIAKPEASETDLQQAINQAGLKSFVSKLPEGLDTWIGEDGKQVSGGEARRIALARVYLKDAAIVLLDEPTEGLDEQTEDEILHCLQNHLIDKTLIIVTHRQSVLKWMDDVYQLEQGELIKIESS